MGCSEKQLNMRTNQLWNWIYVRGAKSISEMTNLSKEFRKELNDNLLFKIIRFIALIRTSIAGKTIKKLMN